jgi:hypothetical protein
LAVFFAGIAVRAKFARSSVKRGLHGNRTELDIAGCQIRTLNPACFDMRRNGWSVRRLSSHSCAASGRIRLAALDIIEPIKASMSGLFGLTATIKQL